MWKNGKWGKQRQKNEIEENMAAYPPLSRAVAAAQAAAAAAEDERLLVEFDIRDGVSLESEVQEYIKWAEAADLTEWVEDLEMM